VFINQFSHGIFRTAVPLQRVRQCQTRTSHL
jgi:hypothetical protein